MYMTVMPIIYDASIGVSVCVHRYSEQLVKPWLSCWPARLAACWFV